MKFELSRGGLVVVLVALLCLRLWWHVDGDSTYRAVALGLLLLLLFDAFRGVASTKQRCWSWRKARAAKKANAKHVSHVEPPQAGSLKTQVLRLSERVSLVRIEGRGAQLLAGARIGSVPDRARWVPDAQQMDLTEEEFRELERVFQSTLQGTPRQPGQTRTG